MKRSLVVTILGLGMAAATTSAFAQGGIDIGSYRGAFNETVWGSGVPANITGTRVLASQGVQIALFYGQGVLASDQLTLSVPLSWNAGSETAGYAGYYGPVVASLPGWAAGQTWSFQVRASGTSSFGNVDTVSSRSVVWQESSNISDIGGNPPGTPGFSQNSIGFVVNVPEPTTFALAGLGGLAALMTYRRRS